MGQAKRMWEEAQDRGFGVDEEIVVCTDCFDDYALKEFIANHNIGKPCSYCKKTADGTCTLEHLLEHAMACIKTEWGHPVDEGLSYVSREGGWIGAVYDSWDLLENVGLEALNEELQNEISSAMRDDEWCERNPNSLTPDKTLFYGWKAFSDFVMYEARYVFLSATPSSYDEFQHDEMHPVKILDALGNIATELGLLITIEPATSIYRVHIVDHHETLASASRLGSPPKEHAKIPNRMSPAGISMFYGAFDVNTAISETYEPSKSYGKKAVVGCFSPARVLNVLDLSKSLSVPSIFDAGQHGKRPIIKFLVEFLQDFTKPISRDDRSHIEYVPTQVVTEYFRHIFRSPKGDKLDGIIYPSSKSKGKAALVLFADNSQCVETSEPTDSNAVVALKNISETNPGRPEI